MNLVQPALRRPVTIVIAVVAVALGSLLAVRQMPRDIFPSLGIPTIYVAQPYGGMDPSQMEAYLTYYYEYHFLYITGIEHVESKCIQSAALIKLQFYPGTDMAQAMSETVAEVDRSRAFMPPGTVPPFVMRFDAGSVPVGDLVFSSDTRSVRELQDEALNRVRPLFAALSGVSATPPFGGSAQSIVINVKPDRLRAYNMSPDEIVSAITAANLISPSGNIPITGMYPMVPLNSVVRNIHDLESVPIRSGTYPAIFLRDVATVENGSDIVTCYALVNGRRTVYIPVTKLADASMLSVVNSVKKNLPRFQAVLPPDVTVKYEFDQSPYVTRAISGLTLEGVLGALLAGLMILLFLRDIRSALMVVVIIPLSLMTAVLSMWAAGQTVNIMTLGGLALAVGILVNQATICIENIYLHYARGKHLAAAAYDATVETAGPQLLAMLCILSMFTPSFFMVGAAKAMFLPMSLAVGFSMVASYVLSNTLLPILSIWFLSRQEKAAKVREAVEHRFDRWREAYRRLAQLVVRHRIGVVAVYLLAAGAVIVFIGARLGTEIFPRVDAGQFQIRLRGPSGTQIDGTEVTALRTLDIIKKEVGPENVAFSLGFIGVHSANYAVNLIYLWNEGPQEAVLQVQLKKGTPVRIEDLKERLRKKFAEQMPDVKFSFEPGDVVSRVMSLGSSTPIEVAISSPDLSESRKFAERVKEKLAGITTLRDVQFGEALDYLTVNVNVDRERAGIMGVQMAKISHSLTTATWSSRFVTPIYWADTNTGVAYQVQVQVPQRAMDSREEVRNIPVDYIKGKTILLRDVANVKEGTMIGEYDRYNMQRMITVTANISGADLGTAARQVENALRELGAPPPRVNMTVRGQVVPMRQMFDGLQAGLLLAVAAIFLLLAANFQSVKLSLIVVSTLPAVIAGVILSLWVTGTSLNIQSFMGAIMAIGVAVANAILLVTFAERARMAGATAEVAAIDGAQGRLRPILMTTLAMIAGMLPLSLGLGESGKQTAPLGRAVVGGLAVATLATLLILPSVFALVQGRAHRRSPSLDPQDPEASTYQPAENQSP